MFNSSKKVLHIALFSKISEDSSLRGLCSNNSGLLNFVLSKWGTRTPFLVRDRGTRTLLMIAVGEGKGIGQR